MRGVGPGRGVAVGPGVLLGVAVGPGVGVGVPPGVAVGPGVAEGLGVTVPTGVGLGVAVGPGVGDAVGLGVGFGVGLGVGVGAVMVLLSSVTAPLIAKARPSSVAPVFSVMLWSAMIVPTKRLPTPSVAELPTCQKMFTVLPFNNDICDAASASSAVPT